MRHRVTKKKMGRDFEHRKSLARNLASSLILNEKIETTLEKAKFVKPYIEKAITKAKKNFASDDKILKFNTLKALRITIGNEEAIKKLTSDLSDRFKDRVGGYTRIIQTGNRDGDNAKTARIELIPAEKKEDSPVKKRKAKVLKVKEKGKK